MDTLSFAPKMMPVPEGANTLTAAEKAEAPGEKVFAVYRGAGAAAGTGKALVIHRAGPYDPANTILYLR